MTIEELIFRNSDHRGRLYLSTEPYFMVKDREEGEKDLNALAVSGKVEGAWIFTDDDLRWRNISSKTSFDEEESIMGVSYHLLVLDEQVSATHYHTHPKIGTERLYSSLVGDGISDEEFIIKLSGAVAVIPSSEDICGYKNYLETNPGSDIDFRIVSPEGITKMVFNAIPDDDAIERYRQAISPRRLATLTLSSGDIRSSITNMVDAANREMNKTFNVSVKYRGKEIRTVKPWYRRIF